MVDIGLLLSIASFVISSFVALHVTFESDCFSHTKYSVDVDDTPYQKKNHRSL